jgi:hypothetical protein
MKLICGKCTNGLETSAETHINCMGLIICKDCREKEKPMVTTCAKHHCELDVWNNCGQCFKERYFAEQKQEQKPMTRTCEKHGGFTKEVCVECLQETGSAIGMSEIKPASHWVEFTLFKSGKEVMVNLNNYSVSFIAEHSEWREIFFMPISEGRSLELLVNETLEEVMEKIR